MLGGTDAGNAQRSIREFIAPNTGNYLLRVSGASAGSYNLVVTRGLELSLPSSVPGINGQDISQTGQVLGYSGVDGIAGGDGAGGTSTNLGVTLFDASGYRWDIQGNGAINDGSNDAYDSGMVNNQMNSFATGLLEDSGRELVIGPSSIGDLRLSRKIFVPTDQSFARFLEIVTNTGSSTTNFTVPIYTNLGSDGSGRFIQSSSGDSLVTVAENWVKLTDEGTDLSVTFDKLVHDAAREACGRAVDLDRTAGGTVIMREARAADRGDHAKYVANLRYLFLRFLGVAIDAGDDPRLAPCLTLLEAGPAPTTDVEMATRWKAVCIGLVTHPDFVTY